MPEDIIYPLKAYLGELPSYDLTLDWNKQKTEEPSKQHGFAQFYFTRTFELLGVSLGHIFKVEQSDVDMRDVVLNRRILVVNLPALESSDERLAALGKIVVASLRGMMAQMLGARLEGDSERIVANKPGMGSAPFHVVLDEVAYYATDGMDRMMAQGRGLNFMFWLGFQEVSGIHARLGEKTQSLLGNANLTVAMRLQDANRTRQWIEETAGDTYVTQASGYQGSGGGEYSESQHAELREVSRVDWNDLQRLIEGEAIVLFGGRRIYAKLFHAAIDVSGPLRLNRPLALREPDAKLLTLECEHLDAVKGLIERGVGVNAPREMVSKALRALMGAFAATASSGGNAQACVDAAIKAAAEAEITVQIEPGELHSEFTKMLGVGLRIVELNPLPEASPFPKSKPDTILDPVIGGVLLEIESSAVGDAELARANALSLAMIQAEVERASIGTFDPQNDGDLIRQINELSAALVKTSAADAAADPIVGEAPKKLKGLSR
jgi:intracellular multiplication protein IcmO